MTGSATSAELPVRLVCCVANPSIDKTADVERLVPGAIHRPSHLTMLPGGKGLNIARAATTLGTPVEAVLLLAGHAGAWVDAALATRGIARTVAWTAGETRTCLSIHDRSAGTLTEVYEAGPELDRAAWEGLQSALGSALERGGPAVVAIGGSLPPGAPGDGHARLAALATGRGHRAIVDTGGAGLLAALATGPWLAKCNAAEAGEATGLDTAGVDGALAAARALRTAGAGAAIVTLGTAGAVLAIDSGTWRIGPPPELGTYAVGSGDAFLAGLVHGVLGGGSLEEAARLGAAVAAANALVPGQGELRLEDVERLRPRIELTAAP